MNKNIEYLTIPFLYTVNRIVVRWDLKIITINYIQKFRKVWKLTAPNKILSFQITYQ
jgi:hypothetical protein